MSPFLADGALEAGLALEPLLPGGGRQLGARAGLARHVPQLHQQAGEHLGGTAGPGVNVMI
jgi:hypothetical protein